MHLIFYWWHIFLVYEMYKVFHTRCFAKQTEGGWKDDGRRTPAYGIPTYQLSMSLWLRWANNCSETAKFAKFHLSYYKSVATLTLKAPNKNCSRRHFNFSLLSFEKNKASFFMWILCLAEDSLETLSLIFSEKQWKNIYECRLLQSWLAL